MARRRLSFFLLGSVAVAVAVAVVLQSFTSWSSDAVTTVLPQGENEAEFTLPSFNIPQLCG